MHVAVLDCTLRDGGCVNDFKFTNAEMNSIKTSLENTGVEFIELGYLDSVKGQEDDSSMFLCEECVERILLNNRRPNTKYFAMVDCCNYSADSLPQRGINTLNGIRLCFHKNQIDKAFEQARIILDKGYELFLQPMITTRYSDEDVRNLIKRVNNELPEVKACYIVDSFGALNVEDLINRLNLFDSLLNSNINIGVHLHNNMNQSMDVIKTILSSNTRHDLIIDCTILGIGKGAGNPILRKVLTMCNEIFEKKYELQYIDAVDTELIKPIYDIYPWGYSYEYELCAKYRLTPSYVKFYREHSITDENDMDKLLSAVPEDKKDAFHKDFAYQHLLRYQNGEING